MSNSISIPIAKVLTLILLTITAILVSILAITRADIRISTEGLYTAISDNANLKLSGSTNDHVQATTRKQKLNTDDLVVLKARNISRLLILY